jgi:hypothetical protein
MHYASVDIQADEKSVEEFARSVFKKLSISQMERRGFPNQDERALYVGSAGGIEFSVFESWEADYPFCVSLGPAGSSQSAEYLVEHAHLLAYQWSRDGWRCRVPKRESAFGHERNEVVYAAYPCARQQKC